MNTTMNIRDHILKSINDGLNAQREVINGKPGVRFFGADEPSDGSFILFENLGYNSEYGYFDMTQFPSQPSDCTNENPEELYIGLFSEGWRPLIWFDDGGNPNMLGDVWQAADVYQMLKDYFEKGTIHGEADEEECESGGMQWLQVADAAYFAHRTNEQRFPDPEDQQLGNSIRVAAERGSIRTRAGESGKLYYHRESVEDWARKDEQRGRPRTRSLETPTVVPREPIAIPADRKAANAILRQNGYRWEKIDQDWLDDNDDFERKPGWYLYHDSTHREIGQGDEAVQQAFDEINRGIDVVAAEKRQRAEEVKQKAQAARECKSAIARVREHIMQAGERPENVAWPEGDQLLDTHNIYGGGDSFVIADDAIWYIRGNGMDGDDWSRNNLRGAIGWRIARSDEIVTELRRLAVTP